MYPEALAYLCCPRCPHTHLMLQPNARSARDGAIVRGRLCCQSCGRSYAITDGIVDFLGFVLPDSPAQITNYLPLTAWAYERLWRWRSLTVLTGEPFGYARELPLMTKLTEPARGGLYIDLACSNGLYARALDANLDNTHGHVIAIDHSLPMLRQGRAFALHEERRISFVRAKAQALPFAPGAAAGVVMGGSLNEIGDLDGCLREMRRVLATEGRAMLMSLTQAESAIGRGLQIFLKLGGIDFLSLDALNRRWQAHKLRLAAQWRHHLVVFSLVLPQ